MKQQGEYRISQDATSDLEALVSRIEAAPGDLIDVRDFAARQEAMDVTRLLETLPAGLSLEDLTGILHLALLTECATDSYAAAIRERAQRFDAEWLARFVDRVWVPDELTHHAPYKHMLLHFGFSEDEIDRQVAETQEREFVHYGGDTPVHVTTFGMVQEYLTDNWHGLIAKLLRVAEPQAAYMAQRVKRRETLHTAWYRDMTALQIEANPGHVSFVAEELARFRMPGNSLLPELQSKVDGWLPLMGADMDRVIKDMLRLLHQVLGTPHELGRLLFQVAAEKGIRIGPISTRDVERATTRLGAPGLGLVGEAALEMAGLDYLYARRDSTRMPTGARVAGTLRDLVRTWLAGEMARRVSALTPGYAPSQPASAVTA
jgi:hypothetical protein